LLLPFRPHDAVRRSDAEGAVPVARRVREEVHRGGERRRDAGLSVETGSRRRAQGRAGLESWTLMADIQTKPNDASVEEFLNRIKDEGRRKDAFAVMKLMKSVTRKKPKMWGPAIVG